MDDSYKIGWIFGFNAYANLVLNIRHIRILLKSLKKYLEKSFN